MSFIPNTTPTPNWLYNGEMKKMTDTELRVVLVVTRKTLGWEENPETGMRKIEDWISHKQLIEQTGKSSRAISMATDNCVRMGWIETRNKKGEILITPTERRRRKIYYRLGSIFTNKLSTANSRVDENLPHFKTKSTLLNDTHLPQRLRYTKETVTKDNYTLLRNVATDVAGKTVNEIITLFKDVNPSYEQLFRNKTQRRAVERLLKKHGEEKVRATILALPKIINKPFAPKIITPLELERDLGKLVAFYNQEKAKVAKNVIGIAI